MANALPAFFPLGKAFLVDVENDDAGIHGLRHCASQPRVVNDRLKLVHNRHAQSPQPDRVNEEHHHYDDTNDDPRQVLLYRRDHGAGPSRFIPVRLAAYRVTPAGPAGTKKAGYRQRADTRPELAGAGQSAPARQPPPFIS